jgi:21S rRNA (uridine2791-2'-O)-methyltransferase
VQSQVKAFLLDPDQGRAKPQPGLAGTGFFDAEEEGEEEEEERRWAIDRKKGRKKIEAYPGRTVDVVLSDMCAPWAQTSGFWKKSLSNPYFRMMNTSGINFKDHTGSMVRCSSLSLPHYSPICTLW